MYNSVRKYVHTYMHEQMLKCQSSNHLIISAHTHITSPQKLPLAFVTFLLQKGREF